MRVDKDPALGVFFLHCFGRGNFRLLLFFLSTRSLSEWVEVAGKTLAGSPSQERFVLSH